MKNELFNLFVVGNGSTVRKFILLDICVIWLYQKSIFKQDFKKLLLCRCATGKIAISSLPKIFSVVTLCRNLGIEKLHVKTDMSSVQITKFNFFQKNTKHTEYFCIRLQNWFWSKSRYRKSKRGICLVRVKFVWLQVPENYPYIHEHHCPGKLKTVWVGFVIHSR